jgi:hypothetical protein
MTKNTFVILSVEKYTDYAKIAEVYGQGCNYVTKLGIDGFQVDFLVKINEEKFNISFQTIERTDNIRAYNGVEMALSDIYGNDSDESSLFITYCEENEIDGHEEFLEKLQDTSEIFAAECLDDMLKEKK